jgi:2,4-dienoyl-CoA reductase (NADPH2)
MGSEGYLINQFVAPQTNHRNDEWGGSFEHRIRFPVEIVRRTRDAVGKEFIIIYRLSMLDLVDGGSNWDEVVQLAQVVEAAGASIINTGIGWHEARIPTIGTMVPRAAFAWVTRRLKGSVSLPLITTNRINDPATGEAILARGDADMVSMARPFLADPEFVNKAAANRADEINTCIGCNQACLDHIFARQLGLVLRQPVRVPRNRDEIAAGRARQRIAVVGAGPAGLACATTAAARGHYVTLFEAAGGDRRPVQPGAPDTREGRIRGNAPVLPHPPADSWACASS